MPKRTVKSVKASCDRLWATLVRARASNTCERCGKPAIHSHHTYGRANHRLRFNVRNGCSYCYQCHVWAESYPLEFVRWFDQERAVDAPYLRLEFQKGPLSPPRTLNDYLELENDLAEQLASRLEAAA